MPEYMLEISSEAGAVTKRMVASNDSTAILEAIRWEDHHSDLRLRCEGRLVAEKRFFLWCLEPEVVSATRGAAIRLSVDAFTVRAGWATIAAGRRGPMASAFVAKARCELLARLRG